MGYGRSCIRVFAPGVAIACAAMLTVCGGGGSDGGSDAPSLATVSTTGSAYRMDYQLDAERRIKSYELRDEALDKKVQWCSGDLHASWDCRDEAHDPHLSISAKVDEQGHPASYSLVREAPFGQTIDYSYSADGRLVTVGVNKWNYGDTTSRTIILEYDTVGLLTVIRVGVFSIKNPFNRGDLTYTVVPPNAVPTHVLITKKGFLGADTDFTVWLDHDGTGRYTQKIVNEVIAGSERTASTLNFVIDGHGYLTSRVSELYQYDPGVTPILRTEEAWCLDWSPSAASALTSEGSCPTSTFYYSIVYPPAQMPSAPLTVFPAYSAASTLDLLCVITDECVDPARMGPRPY
jgi:hypothetical protein